MVRPLTAPDNSRNLEIHLYIQLLDAVRRSNCAMFKLHLHFQHVAKALSVGEPVMTGRERMHIPFILIQFFRH